MPLRSFPENWGNVGHGVPAGYKMKQLFCSALCCKAICFQVAQVFQLRKITIKDKQRFSGRELDYFYGYSAGAVSENWNQSFRIKVTFMFVKMLMLMAIFYIY